ncbi:MAG: 16S rRNA (uracil(1498)-N(3))-methyltransferase [Desulfovibrionaceae bacterium]
MARLNSFYLPPQAWPESGRASLSGAEAHHLAVVLRHKPGDVVRLFDGQGAEGLFTVLSCGKKLAELEARETARHQRPEGGLVLALGWNKSSRREWLLEKGVELGAAELCFWQAARSQGRIPHEIKDKWQDKLIQAAKQCGALWLPELTALPGPDALLERGRGIATRLLLWERAGQAPLLSPSMLSGPSLAVIGPEGGLEDDEARRFLDSGYTAVTLGGSILRWETAALHCLSLAYYQGQAAQAAAGD